MTRTLGQFAAEIERRAEALPRLVEAELRSTGLDVVGKAQENVRTRLKVRSGRLMRSIRQEVALQGAKGTLTVRAGGGAQDVAYARLQELGGTVKPKKGRFLAIPTDLMKTASGVGKVASPRQVPGLTFIPIHGGAMGLLVRDRPGRGKANTGARMEVMFRLVPSVMIKAKHYLGDAFSDGTAGLTSRLQERLGVLIVSARVLS